MPGGQVDFHVVLIVMLAVVLALQLATIVLVLAWRAQVRATAGDVMRQVVGDAPVLPPNWPGRRARAMR